jgi:hypothetical protein
MPTPLLSLALLAAPLPDKGVECPLAVQFGSYAMGIDTNAARRIERFLEKRREVAGVSRHPWGREGEYTLCVRLKRGASPASLARQVKALIPAKPRGPIQVLMPGT